MEEHKAIKWVGEPIRRVAGKVYYHACQLSGGQIVSLGTAVRLKAPKGQESYLAAVLELFQEEMTGLKMMKNQWYFRPEEAVNGRKKAFHVRELFNSDTTDINFLTTVEAPITVSPKP